MPLLITVGFWAIVALIGIAIILFIVFVAPEILPEGFVHSIKEYWPVAFLLVFTIGSPLLFMHIGNDKIRSKEVISGYFAKGFGIVFIPVGLAFLLDIFECGLDAVNCEWTPGRLVLLILMSGGIYVLCSKATKNNKVKTALLEKIEKVKAEEIFRLEQKKEEEEEKQRKQEKRNEPGREIISQITPELQELKKSYLKDEEIDIKILDMSISLIFGNPFTPDKKIFITPTSSGKNYTIDSPDEDDVQLLNRPEEVIDYVIKKIGEFLATRESG